MSIKMSKPETTKSHTLAARVADLTIKLQEAHIAEGEMKVLQKVAALMEDRPGPH